MSMELRIALESTLLGLGVTDDGIRAMAAYALREEIAGVCVPPVFVPTASAALAGSTVRVVTVVGFPYGDLGPDAAAGVASEALRQGAREIDLVAPLHAVESGDAQLVQEMVRRVRDVLPEDARLKVILECSAFDDRRIRRAGEAAIRGGAHWLKTSTGMHPAGGATAHHVRLLREIAPPGVGVKASGGVRSRADAIRMLEAGADRIGTSSAAAILGGLLRATASAY
jgi:deoxyribose-phosphate aldolase